MAAPGAEPQRDGLSASDWNKVGELFHVALSLPQTDRQSWIDTCVPESRIRNELQSLLESDRIAAEGFVDRELKAAVLSFYESSDTRITDRRVGPYRLVREVGRGGMGTVFLAERDDDEFQAEVAIKLVRPGMDADFILHRFRRERQTLAQLKHPHIAQLIDGGTTDDGLPYIVMEFIDGVRITTWCDEHSLSCDERLRLFLDVCSAIEYAHRRFVVHRDIKPGNILVDTSGSVKLLDFGICKLLHSSPEAGAQTIETDVQMLTPDYASPEQIRGDPITVASDVYSLAAVLYELLTGAKPHRFDKHTPAALEHAICESQIVPPSLATANNATARRLKGDLDNILLCGLQKDPLRRYASVEQFSEDVRKHLAHQPVAARADTAFYRLAKFARRRRGAVAAVGSVILALAAGVVVSMRQARIAEDNLAQVRRLANKFVFEVHDAVRDLPGSTRARQLIVQTGLDYLNALSRNSSGDPELQIDLAAAWHRIGDVQGAVLSANLGNTAGALASYRKALEILDSAAGSSPSNRISAERVELHRRIADIHAYTRNAKDALAEYAQSISLGESLLARTPEDESVRRQIAGTEIAAADVVRLSGNHAGAIGGYSKALAILLESARKHPEDKSLQELLASAYSAIGMCEVRMGRLREGLGRYRHAVERMERLTQLDPANTSAQRGLMFAYAHVGDVLGNPQMVSLGDTSGAVAAYRRMTTVARRVHENDPADQRAASDYGVALARLAVTLPDAQNREKLALAKTSVNLHERISRADAGNLSTRADLASSYGLLGDALQFSGERAGAVRAYSQSLSLSETLLNGGTSAPLLLAIAACRKLGEAMAAQGSISESLSYGNRALAITDPSGAMAKDRPAALQRFVAPRGSAAMGLIYAELSRSVKISAEQRPAFRAKARQWLNISLATWRKLESDPLFAFPHRKEMGQVERGLAAVSGPHIEDDR